MSVKRLTAEEFKKMTGGSDHVDIRSLEETHHKNGKPINEKVLKLRAAAESLRKSNRSILDKIPVHSIHASPSTSIDKSILRTDIETLMKNTILESTKFRVIHKKILLSKNLPEAQHLVNEVLRLDKIPTTTMAEINALVGITPDEIKASEDLAKEEQPSSTKHPKSPFRIVDAWDMPITKAGVSAILSKWLVDAKNAHKGIVGEETTGGVAKFGNITIDIETLRTKGHFVYIQNGNVLEIADTLSEGLLWLMFTLQPKPPIPYGTPGGLLASATAVKAAVRAGLATVPFVAGRFTPGTGQYDEDDAVEYLGNCHAFNNVPAAGYKMECISFYWPKADAEGLRLANNNQNGYGEGLSDSSARGSQQITKPSKIGYQKKEPKTVQNNIDANGKFGKIHIDRGELNDGWLHVRSHEGKTISRTVSRPGLKHMLTSPRMSERMTDEIVPEDIHNYQQLLELGHVRTKSGTKQRTLAEMPIISPEHTKSVSSIVHRLEILTGSIQAGNNGVLIRNEIKGLLEVLVKDKQMTQEEADDYMRSNRV